MLSLNLSSFTQIKIKISCVLVHDFKRPFLSPSTVHPVSCVFRWQQFTHGYRIRGAAKLAELAWKGEVHFTLLDASSINYQYNYLCLIKMLCCAGRRLGFCTAFLTGKHHCGVSPSKINVSLHCLILCLYTNQVKVLLSKQRICLYKREQLAHPTSIRGLFVWDYTIIREGPRCLFWTANLLM